MSFLLAAIAIGGCQATILKPTEADESRRDVQRLEMEVERLVGRVAGLEAELAMARRMAAGVSEEGLDALAGALPIPVRLELGRFSGPVRGDDGRATVARLYLRPVDGRGRFVHPLGNLTVDVLVWPSGVEPVMRTSVQRTPSQLADAYRSGPTGTHYTIELPLEPPLGSRDSLVVRCTLTNAVTGQEIAFERVFPSVE